MSDPKTVVSLSEARAKKAQETEEKSAEELKAETDLAAIADKNKKNEERLRRERLQANKSVLRSYRIKH